MKAREIRLTVSWIKTLYLYANENEDDDKCCGEMWKSLR